MMFLNLSILTSAAMAMKRETRWKLLNESEHLYTTLLTQAHRSGDALSLRFRDSSGNLAIFSETRYKKTPQSEDQELDEAFENTELYRNDIDHSIRLCRRPMDSELTLKNKYSIPLWVEEGGFYYELTTPYITKHNTGEAMIIEIESPDKPSQCVRFTEGCHSAKSIAEAIEEKGIKYRRGGETPKFHMVEMTSKKTWRVIREGGSDNWKCSIIANNQCEWGRY